MRKKNLLKTFIFFLALIFAKFSFSQKEMNTWYFGANAGLDFNSGTPLPLKNGKIHTSEGCSSISDCSGNILFYTDGMTVWNKNHQVMPNGSGLKGHNSSTQSALIVQKPGSTTIYYIFTIGTIDYNTSLGNRQLCLNELDITLNGGLGDISKKNILLYNSSCEKLAGLKHCDGKRIWVLTHDWNSNTFRAFLVSSAGVDLNPVLSSCGIVATGKLGNSIGQLKGSPDASKIASAIEGNICRFELFDFNNSTGQVFNPILFPNVSSGCYGVEFSPDGSKLYAGTSSPSHIYQYDLSAGSNESIINSGVIVGSGVNNILFGSFQLGPDNRIYIARSLQPYLGVINYPNKKGTACNYVTEGVFIGNLSVYGLPNMLSSYSKISDLPFTYKINCLQGFFTSPQSIKNSPVLSVSWNFDDPLSGENNASVLENPMHLFTKPGTYDVTLLLHYKCSSDTLVQKVVIDAPRHSTTTISGVNSFCSDKNAALSGTVTGSYKWNTGDTTTTITAALVTTNYSVVITTSAGCTFTAAKTISVNPLPLVTATAYTLGELTSQLEATGGVVYKWSPSEGLSCTDCPRPLANYPSTITYCVKVTDDKGCSGSSCVELLVSSAFIPNAFTPNEDHLNDEFVPVVSEVHDYNFLIFDRWGNKLFEAAQPGKGWNGYYKGKLCDENLYVYKLNFIDNVKNEPHEYAGTVALIR